VVKVKEKRIVFIAINSTQHYGGFVVMNSCEGTRSKCPIKCTTILYLYLK
jgi:hypothetical protein